MSNDLVSNADLDGFPGAPYPTAVVDSAVADLRREAGWHIAPQVEETLTLDGPEDSDYLILPTLKLVAVTEIRDVSGDTPVVLADWRASRSKGMIYRAQGWPCGFEAIEVDLTHGYDVVPADLLPEIASRCRRAGVDVTIKKVSIDDYTEEAVDPSELGAVSSDVFANYALLPGRV